MSLLKRFLLLLAASAVAAAAVAQTIDDTGEDKDFRMKRILEGKRKGKLLNLFQIVRFPNQPCNGTSSTTVTTSTTSKSGICYTAAECSDRGGNNEGTCASGFGVCCSFTMNCGDVTTENCTYFDSSSPRAGACSVMICPCNDNICQLRLDFISFSITGPVVSTATAVTLKQGVLSISSTAATTRTQCNTDTFSVTNPGGSAPPVICGSNTGDHMYVDASSSCNTLTFNLGSAGVGTAISTRMWSIKVSQYSCDYVNLAPDGCTQYFYDTSGTGTIQSYNYDGNIHLASQEQIICIRQERAFCRMCVYAANPADFGTSGAAASVGLAGTAQSCCAYGTASATKGYDCIIIPGASKTAISNNGGPSMVVSNFCGSGKGLVTSTTATTVCTQTVPYTLTFLSDRFEDGTGAAGESSLTQGGFQLIYAQDSINCFNNN